MARVRDITLLPTPKVQSGQVYTYRAMYAAEHEWTERYYTDNDMAQLIALLIEANRR